MINREKIKIPGKKALAEWTEKAGQKINDFREKRTENTSSDEMMALSSKVRRHYSKEKIRTIAAVAAVLALVLGLLIHWQTRVFHRYSIESSVERSDDAVTQYARVKNRILKCNPNGVTCVNGANEVQWNTTFTMQSPIIDVCGSMVAVGDQRGSQIYIFNDKGLVGSFSVEHTLTKVKVASQGVVAAVLEDGETTWIDVYDSQGNVLVKNKTSMAESGYPVDIDISSNGQKMMVSYLGIDNSNVKSRVVFYNFSSVGQGQAGNLMSSAEYVGHVVPQVSFLGGDYAAAYRDDGITFFAGRQAPAEKTSITVEPEMISTFCSDEYVGYVIPNQNEKRTEKYCAQIYHKNGGKSADIYFNMEYTDIGLQEQEMILYNTKEIAIYSVSGRKKFFGQYEKPIVEVTKLGGSRSYSVQTADSTDKIKLK